MAKQKGWPASWHRITGRSVIWKTDLNPIPNRPILFACSCFWLVPIPVIASMSSRTKGAPS